MGWLAHHGSGRYYAKTYPIKRETVYAKSSGYDVFIEQYVCEGSRWWAWGIRAGEKYEWQYCSDMLWARPNLKRLLENYGDIGQLSNKVIEKFS